MTGIQMRGTGTDHFMPHPRARAGLHGERRDPGLAALHVVYLPPSGLRYVTYPGCLVNSES